ncbi:MAG TPA: hypothetical protein PK869_07270, partial [Candidatus Hydrogenedentes bacterium]|nr:hypothetical protein [Candidatus Hydrogenedentota bacterium]
DRPAVMMQVCQAMRTVQCEDGGRSAIPQALAAYVREQAQDSPLRLMTPPPSKDKSKTVRPETAVVPGFSKRWLAFSCVAFATLACIAGASVWFGMQDSRPAAPAHVMNASRFQPQPDGSMIAELPVPAYTAVRLGWAGAEPALLVEVQGMEHLMSRGSAGILAFAPESKQCMNIATPAGASLAEGIDSARAYPLALSSGQRSASTTPTILLAQRGANNAKSTGLVFAQRWNEAAPSINPLATYESTAPGTAPWHSADARAMHAVLRPDGGAVCAIIENADGTNYLAEQRVNGGSPLQKLTGTGARILPHSVQYAPDGTRVYYMRQDNAGKQELWSTPVAGTDSTLLMVGYFDGGVAISPDGSRIATAWSTTAAEQAELRVIDAKDGTILHRLDPGTVGHDAWAHTADRLLIAARGDDRIRQLQLIDPENPATRRVLTSLPGGVGKATALSADGRWAAGIAEGGSGVRVVFVDLNDPESTRTAARTTATDVNRL